MTDEEKQQILNILKKYTHCDFRELEDENGNSCEWASINGYHVPFDEYVLINDWLEEK